MITPAFERRNYYYLLELDKQLHDNQKRGIFRITLESFGYVQGIEEYLTDKGYTVIRLQSSPGDHSPRIRVEW